MFALSHTKMLMTCGKVFVSEYAKPCPNTIRIVVLGKTR